MAPHQTPSPYESADEPGTRRPATATAQVAQGRSRAPWLPRSYVPRQQLWDRLEAATANAVTLVVAPAGAGKTLGTAGWLRRTRRDADTVWLNGDKALHVNHLSDVLGLTSSLADGAEDPGEGDEAAPRLVVIDDAQQLPSATVRFIDRLLNQQPDSIRLLLLSRWDLPLTRLVPELLGHLTVLRGDVLKLTSGEARALITQHARTDSPAVIEAIMARTQGWCVAVVLAARAAAAAPDPVAAANRYRDAGPAAADLVTTEVFAALHSRERHLLLCVASEPTVTPDIATHLTHDAQAGEILATLESTGLLVTRAPEPDEEYRVHPLMLEVVRRRLVAGGVDVMQARSTVLRAVRLDLGRGESDEAFRRLVAIGEYDEAARVLVHHGLSLLMHGQGPTVNAFVRRAGATVERHPDAWISIALDRWLVGDLDAARHWIERIIDNAREGGHGRASVQLACARLIRAQCGLEPMTDAAAFAAAVAESLVASPRAHSLLPLLVLELGVAHNWLGRLVEAEARLSHAITLGRTYNLAPLTVAAFSHLALTQYMQGREQVSLTLTEEASRLLGPDMAGAACAGARLSMLRQLVLLQDLPWPERAEEDSVRPGDLRGADLATKFWQRLLRARLMRIGGSVAEAERALEAPHDALALPGHLHVSQLMEQAAHAFIRGDRAGLGAIAGELGQLGADGEGAWVSGLQADLAGDLRAAAEHHAAAAVTARHQQPATRETAMVCRAQLLDALGRQAEAERLVLEAAGSTEGRRNTAPFLGWSMHGTPVGTLMERATRRAPSRWGMELAAAYADHPGIVGLFGPVTATQQEMITVAEPVIRPVLSPREREVLYELARGATYADIASNLFVSENTVKTHISSLYAKLSVGRRSEALAVARKLHLL